MHHMESTLLNAGVQASYPIKNNPNPPPSPPTPPPAPGPPQPPSPKPEVRPLWAPSSPDTGRQCRGDCLLVQPGLAFLCFSASSGVHEQSANTLGEAPERVCACAGVRHGNQLPAGRDLLLHARVLRLLLHLGLLPAPGARRLLWLTLPMHANCA